MSGLVGYLTDPVKITTGFDTSNLKEWTFDDQGNIVLPSGGDIVDNNGLSVLGEASGGTRKTNSTLVPGAPAIIWSALSGAISSAKLFVQVECQVEGDLIPHTQTCEIIIASRGGSFDPAISVYGIVYTSASPLVTFTAQRGPAFIEVLGNTTEIVVSNVLVRIYSIEQDTRYP